MNRRLIGILIIFAGLIMIIGIIFIIFFYDFSKEEVVELPVAQEESGKEMESKVKPPAEKVEKPKEINIDQSKENLKRMSASFTERFGSYSNHSNYSNIIDLKIFMSKKMQKWADDFMAKVRLDGAYSGIYYGITTKAVQEEVNEFNESSGQAEILVKTQRRESLGNMSNASIKYQDIIITFVKEGGAWKADSAIWQE